MIKLYFFYDVNIFIHVTLPHSYLFMFLFNFNWLNTDVIKSKKQKYHKSVKELDSRMSDHLHIEKYYMESMYYSTLYGEISWQKGTGTVQNKNQLYNWPDRTKAISNW